MTRALSGKLDFLAHEKVLEQTILQFEEAEGQKREPPLIQLEMICGLVGRRHKV